MFKLKLAKKSTKHTSTFFMSSCTFSSISSTPCSTQHYILTKENNLFGLR